MNKEQLKKDIDQVNAGLKNFQNATVDHIFDLFTNKGRRRVLVADEVGLGKTVIARGTLAKLAEHSLLTNNKKTFKAIYFCSNSAILDQNLKKLQITKEKSDAAVSYRLSMLSLQLWKLNKELEAAGDGEKLIRLIPLTPNTSLKVSASFGKDSERKLIFTVLQMAAESDQELSDCIDLLKDILSRKSNGETIKGWDAMCEKTAPDSRGSDDETTEDGESEDEVEIDDQTDDEVTAEDGVSGDDGVFKPYTDDKGYIEATAEKVLTALKGTSLPDEIKELNSEMKDRFDGAVEGLFKSDKDRIKKIVGGLRHIFAEISLDQLKADLIVMDEFQRFKDLLCADPDSEVGMLMEKFKGSETNILLLSATPYKPFVSEDGVDDSGESEVEEDRDTSKKELEELMQFLTEGSGVSADDFKKVWDEHTAALKEFAGSAAPETYEKAKATAAEASEMMSGYICRTERLSAEGSGSLFGSDIIPDITPEKAEVTLFLKSLELPKKPKPELVRSSPYILSFAQGDYKFKEVLKED